MIQISESAQSHFRKLIEREALPGLGVRVVAVEPNTTRADVRIEFAEPTDLHGTEWAIKLKGFTLWLDAASVKYLNDAQIDYEHNSTGGQLQIRAPGIKPRMPDPNAPMLQRVLWVVENEINPKLALHKGSMTVREVTTEGVVVVRFGGGCHGCGMVDMTLKNGVEKALFELVPGVTAVRDETDHETGAAPYAPRKDG